MNFRFKVEEDKEEEFYLNGLSSYKYLRKISFAAQTFVLSCFLISCVGTIEDKNPEITKGASTDTLPITFEGVFEAVAIADTKIDVYFYPSNIEPKNVTYLISYDGLQNPISVPGTTLKTNHKGLLKYTVTGLNINTNYTFSVQAKDISGSISTSAAVYTEKTFENITGDFAGISNVRNLAGEDGRTSLRVEWPAARIEGNTFYPNEIDPNQYEIILLDAENLTPNAFDDDFFGEPNRKKYYVAGSKVSHQINGLSPGTKYYVRVRTIHQGFVDYGADVDYKKEENSNYILAQTLSDDASNVEVDLTTFNVDILSLNSATLAWEGAEGPLVEYRVYYRNMDDGGLPWSSFRTSRNTVCDGEDGTYPEWRCKKLDFTETSTKLADLEPLADYEMIAVICMTTGCEYSNSIEYENQSPYTIFPGIANFSGINEIEQPKYYWSVDEVYLKIASPDFSSGAIDGLLVEAKARTADDGPVNNTILNHPTAGNPSNLNVDNFDYTSDDTITVTGVQTDSDEQYCFSVLPFIYNEGVVQISRDGEVTRCVTPTVALPDEEQFEGLNFSTTIPDTSTNTISLNWSAPEGGIYDKFRIFIRDSSGGETFEFSDAVNPLNTDYVMVEVPYGTTSYTFSFLPDGVYTIGVLPYYSNNMEYAPYNSNIYTFDTDD
jgi:hypothetical protein